MDSRESVRFPVSIEIRFYLWSALFWKNLYAGTVENLSEKGMYIRTKTLYVPRDALLEIYVPFRKNFMCIPVKPRNIIWRRALSDHSCDGLGIELSHPPQVYREFIESLKTNSSN